MVGTSGLEPPTSRLSGVRSNHLSYAPNNFLPLGKNIVGRVLFRAQRARFRKRRTSALFRFLFLSDSNPLALGFESGKTVSRFLVLLNYAGLQQKMFTKLYLPFWN